MYGITIWSTSSGLKSWRTSSRFSGLQTEAQFMSNLVLNVDGSIGKPSHAGTKFELETRIMKPCWTIRHPWERKSKLLLSCSQWTAVARRRYDIRSQFFSYNRIVLLITNLYVLLVCNSLVSHTHCIPGNRCSNAAGFWPSVTYLVVFWTTHLVPGRCADKSSSVGLQISEVRCTFRSSSDIQSWGSLRWC